jgi:TPR repeat protein
VAKSRRAWCANAYYNLANSYIIGRGVVIDKKKATHYWELAAMNGSVGARHNLGTHEYEGGKYHRSMKHFNLAAAKAGDDDALNTVVKGGYIDGYVTKEEYANTFREYQKIRDEMKSEARDKALEYIKRVEMR